jgi:hypothetical protein
VRIFAERESAARHRHWWFDDFKGSWNGSMNHAPGFGFKLYLKKGFAAANQACCHLGRQFDQFLGKLHLPFTFVRTTNPANVIPWFRR